MENAVGYNGKLSNIILDLMGTTDRGWGVDVGASDGVTVNSTYSLEKNYGWNILSVEPNIDFAKSLRYHRAFVDFCACSAKPGRQVMRINDDNPEAFSSLNPTRRRDLPGIEQAKWRSVEVKVDTVDRLLTKWEFPKLDLICVDTEGTEKDVLVGANLDKWQPKVVVSECWDEDGGEALKYLEEKGYKRAIRMGVNDIYIREER